MYTKKQINVEDYIGEKTIIMNFIPVSKNIGSKTFINNIVHLYSKLNKKTKCLVLDMDNGIMENYSEEKLVNNVKVRMNKNFTNIYYVNIEGLKGRVEDSELIETLVKKLKIDIIFIKNNQMIKNQAFENLSTLKYLKKTFLLTDLDSDNILSLYKNLVYERTKHAGTIILKSYKGNTFKYKKIENLLDIKNYSKVLCVSNHYRVVEYAKMRKQDLFRDTVSINETEIYAEYEDNLNVLLGKPTKGFARKWVKKAN